MSRNYIKELSSDILRTKITFNNRYGLTIVGDLYYKKSLDLNTKHKAVIIGAPYGGVKEQGPCIYAEELAKRGFVALTFNQSFMGESSGYPRHLSSPDIFSENFSACVDYLGVLSYVDRDKIAVIGICGSAGFALSASQVDTRIKGVIAVSMYDMTEAVRLGSTKESLESMKNALSLKRWEDFENGYPEYIKSFPEEPYDELPSEIEGLDIEWNTFYATKRGHHKNARGNFTTTSVLSLLQFRLLDHIEEISPRPIMFIVGDNAHSKFFSEEAYSRALEPKELVVVKDAIHIDLYDRVDLIPFDKIEEFLNNI